MKVIDLNVEDLKAYENNPRNNDDAVDKVAESIRQFGFKVPIVIDSEKIIVTGHTRVLAAKKLGLKKVPCIVADDLSPEQIKAFRLADNKVAEFSSWDFEKLETELAELSELQFDMTAFDLFAETKTHEPVETKTKEAPESFDVIEDELETEHECPKCGYKW